MPIRILIADDHAVLRAGVNMLLNAQPDMEVVGEADDGVAAVEVVKKLRPDVILLDIAMPHGRELTDMETMGGHATGLALARRIRELSAPANQ